MKKNILQAKKALLALFAVLLPLLTSAQGKIEIDGIWYNLVSKAKQAEVTFWGDDPYLNRWYSGSITIPATVTYDGVAYSVTSIGESAFYWCENLTAITIPESVTSIGDFAFSHCHSLTAITLPEGVTNIGDGAFSYCGDLTSITLPEGVTNIGDDVFLHCGSLADITIPEGVTSIGKKTFFDCSDLTTITLPESVASIGDDAFGGCRSLTDIIIPKGLASIGYYAFSYCSALTSITIPEGVTNIGNGAFSNCSSLTAITVAKGNTNYDSRNGCNAIIETDSNTLIVGCSTTIIPESVTGIGDCAFFECGGLTSINIPEGVTSIGDYAFYCCVGLTSINIPESVTNIGAGVFSMCFRLTAITVAEGNTTYDSRNGCNAIIETKSNTLIAGCPTTIIPESVTGIGDYAFYECHLTSISIPEGVKSIGDYAFSYCNLASINIPEGVTSIGDYAFSGSFVLSFITLPKSLKSIGSGAFANYSGQLDVYCYAETVPSTESDAFEGLEPECSTLHVPASALDAYKTTVPWSGFGKFDTVGSTDGVLNIPANPLLISAQDGTIVLNGLATGAEVAAYSISGVQLATATATDGTATLATGLEVGSTAIVKIGDNSVKVVVK